MQMEPQQQDAPTGPEHITDESKKLDTLDLELRSIEDKSVGCLLGCMFGDAIGAAVEGHLAKDIREEFPLGLTRYVPRSHMGVYQLGPRRGMYTDDSQCMLALLSSLVSNKGLDPEDCAMSYALFFQHKPLRGYPRSAQMVFKGLLGGVSYTNTGRIAFKDGSYANGGCMRIHPVGVAFRNATNDELYEAVRLAIISSHVHPCGIVRVLPPLQ
jgi:ADP-ribosylglycohydrolase